MDIKICKIKDLTDIYGLWNKSLGDLWPIEIAQLENRLIQGMSFVAENNGKLLGYVNCQFIDKKGQITLIMVNKDKQRKGIGTQLLNEARKYLTENGIETIVVGSGAGSYFWPGIPKNLISAINFFRKNGLVKSETNLDMALNLQNYVMPADITINTASAIFKISTIQDEDRKDLTEFEKLNFSNWVKYFNDTKNNNILIARLKSKIVGSVILLESKGFIWSKLLDESGGFGALGVSEEQRGKGIGLALAARATGILKERGNKNSFLGWTYLDKWYGKLGYKVWREYTYGHFAKGSN